MGSSISAEQAREEILAALDAIDAAHGLLRETSSGLVGNAFRVDVAERLETQQRVNRGLMYRFFGEIADPPDEAGAIAAMRSELWKRLRITPAEITRRCKLAARIRPRRSLTGPPVAPELPELAAAVEAGAVGDDHVKAVCRAVDVLPACVSSTDVTAAERTLVDHARAVDAGIVVKLGQRIADYLNPDGLFSAEDRARRRGLRLGTQGPDGMSRLSGWLDPETRAYFEAIAAAVRPGRHQRDTVDSAERDDRTPAQRCHDALTFGLRTAIASGDLGVHRGHPVTVVITTTLAELNQAAHAAVDASVPMPPPARTGGGSRLPMRALISMAANAIHYLAVFDNHTERPLYLGRQKRIATQTNDSSATHEIAAAPGPHCLVPGYYCEVHHGDDWGRGGRTDATSSTSCAAMITAWSAAAKHTGGHRRWATGMDRRHCCTRHQPRSPPRRTPARRSRPTRSPHSAGTMRDMCGRFAVTTDPAVLAEKIEAINEARRPSRRSELQRGAHHDDHHRGPPPRRTRRRAHPARPVDALGADPAVGQGRGRRRAGVQGAIADQRPRGQGHHLAGLSRAAPNPSAAWSRWTATTNGAPTPTADAGKKARKTPFFLHRADGEMLFMAGLWSVWKTAQGPPTPVLSCTIITTDAVGGLARSTTGCR